MKPAPVAYFRPESVAEAIEYLGEHEGSARVLAGGQSLIPMLSMRLMQPLALIDINRIAELGELRADGSDTVLGALVRYVAIQRSPVLTERLPLLTGVIRHIGDLQVRNRGTIGGSLAQADPTGEMALACLTLDATVIASSVRGDREIAMDDFLLGAYWAALEPDEMITAVRIPMGADSCAFLEQCRKHNDFAVISVAVTGSAGPSGWSNVRIGLGGVNDRAMLAVDAARVLNGSELEDDVIEEAAQLALDVVDPPSDVRASAEYRRHLVPIYVRRALRQLRDERKGSDV